ncbi:hypothetical protein KP509_13G073900 [Ceratopteris richardii]|uniref:non-specific serine/threonine protein kinase n=1 Tax=Ceratopteris richardii TaxID=49495 RepID=A0A8T2TEN4_CERRI|nr:hypothetical protein KP509_13G073900 [Ceratopteris richardii]
MPICLICAVILLLLASRSHSPSLALEFNYTPTGLNVEANLTSVENVSFDEEFIDLSWNTSGNSLYREGRIYNNDRLPLWNKTTGKAASFHSTSTFRIVSYPGVPSADGIAFFLLDPLYSSSVSGGGSLGLPKFTLYDIGPRFVAVEFDTYLNTFDPKFIHLGIDVNTTASKVYTNFSFSIIDSTIFTWVDYNSSQALLQVYVSNVSETKPRSPMISYSINLSQILPEQVIIGFSASTGRGAEIHKLLSWRFWSTDIETEVPEKPVSSKRKVVFVIALVTGLAIACIIKCLITPLLLQCCCKQQLLLLAIPSDSDNDTGSQTSSDLDVGSEFDCEELRRITNNFGEDHLLDSDGDCPVYKGILSDGSEVAVKCVALPPSKAERKELLEAITMISQLRHQNLVEVQGWCRDNAFLFVVSDHKASATLHEHLHQRPSSILDWSSRYQVLCDLGSALEYLHLDCQTPMIHRDVNSSNVIVYDDGSSKLVGGFGLAKELMKDMEGTDAGNSGTMGYIAPELHRGERATTRSDVYSYGIVLLETASGRTPNDPSLPFEHDGRLLGWVREAYSNDSLLETSDVRLEDAFDEQELLRTLIVGLACAQPDPSSRPTIDIALACLRGGTPLSTVMDFNET